MRYSPRGDREERVSEESDQPRFCPVHGDYLPVPGETACPRCEADPIAARASMRSVKVVTSEMPAITDPDEEEERDALTTIDDEAPCPSCGRLVSLELFQSEALGEEWEGEAALWAEDGVCRTCYRDVMEQHIRRWTTEEWVAHHFEGWRAQLHKVHEVEVLVDSDQDAWLPNVERHRILDVSATLSARREHLARSQMRLRELRGELELDADPPAWVAELEEARSALGEAARAELERRREADLAREKDRRVRSVTELSPAQALADAGLDPDDLLGDLARSTGSKREIRVPDFADLGEPAAERRTSRWPMLVVGGALALFALWWLFLR